MPHHNSANLKLNKHMGVSDPDVWRSIKLFQTEECNASLSLHRALKCDLPRSKRSAILLNEAMFAQYKAMLVSSDMNVDTYMKYVS